MADPTCRTCLGQGVIEVEGCTCGAPVHDFGHEPTCGLEPCTDCPAPRPPDDAIPCTSCQAPILFVTVSNNQGKKPSKMPVDAEPNPEGNVAAFRDVHKRLVGRVLTAKQQPTPYETRYMPHFATCTAPEQHRRRQRGNWTSAVSARNADQRRGRARRPPPPIGPGQTRLHPGRDNRP